jgi:hypothetical protein
VRALVLSIEQGLLDPPGVGSDTSERTSSAKVKTMMIVDPDGNHFAFAEAIDQGLAR